jgi:2-phospho-L-lactate guanylyltransferase
MLADVLRTLDAAGILESGYVVSSDQAALRLARKLGATPVEEQGNRGVNAAVKAGIQSAVQTEILVVPGDLPLLGPSDLEEVMSLRSSGADVVLSPSMPFDGTNLLYFSRRRMLPLSFDNDSFWNHLVRAGSLGYSVAIYTGPGTRCDVDTFKDITALSSTQITKPSITFARKVLERWAS